MTADAIASRASGTRRKKRRPLLAFVLSLACPGLGQLYATRVTRGTRMLAVTAAVIALASVLAAIPPVGAIPVVLMCGLAAASVLYRIGAAIDAWWQARRAGVAALTQVNRLWVYLATGLLLGAAPAFTLPPLSQWKSYSIPAASMIPTIMVGDYLVAWRDYFADHAPQPGDLVVFKLPRDNTTDYVKRIVGLPGQRVQMRGGRLFIDDVAVARGRIRGTDPAHSPYAPPGEYLETLPNGISYRIFEDTDTGPADETPAVTVPPGHVFVLGDNRDNSLDSRMPLVGLVPLANLRDRPGVIFWARDRGRLFQVLR
jgi:signal peptidase I